MSAPSSEPADAALAAAIKNSQDAEAALSPNPATQAETPGDTPAITSDAPAVSAATDEAPEAVTAKSPKAGLFTSFPFKRGAGATSPGSTSPAALSPAEDKEKHAPFIAGLRRRFTGKTGEGKAGEGKDGEGKDGEGKDDTPDAAPEPSAIKPEEETPVAAPVEAAPVKDKSRPSSPPFLAKLRGRISSHGTPGTGGKTQDAPPASSKPFPAVEGEAAAAPAPDATTEPTAEHAPPAAGLSEREKRRTSLVDGFRRLIVSPGAPKRSSSHGPADAPVATEAPVADADATAAPAPALADEPAAAPAVPDKKADDSEKKSPTFVEKLQQRFGSHPAPKSSSTGVEDKVAPAAEPAPSTSATATPEGTADSKPTDAPAAAGSGGLFASIKDRVNQQLHGGKAESKPEVEKAEIGGANSSDPLAAPAQGSESAAASPGHTSPKRREASTSSAVKRISGLFTARRVPSDAPPAVTANDATPDVPGSTDGAPVIPAVDAPAPIISQTVTVEPAAVEASDAAPAAEADKPAPAVAAPAA